MRQGKSPAIYCCYWLLLIDGSLDVINKAVIFGVQLLEQALIKVIPA